MTFKTDIEKFVKTAQSRLKNTAIEAVYELSERIVYQTPIDVDYGPSGTEGMPIWHDPRSVGDAKGGWVAGINGLARTNPQRDPEGSSTNRANYSVYLSYNPLIDKSLNLFNNVPYIRDIEFGHYRFADPVKSVGGYSFQAPKGMARINIKRWGTIVGRAARRART